MELRSSDGVARVSFTGAMPLACGERYWNVALLAHREYVHGLFKQLWEDLGGSLRGGVRDGMAAAGAKPFAVIDSPSAAEVVRDVNKFSNNVMARQVFLTLSAATLKLPGRSDRSIRTIQSWLSARGLDLPELVMENGAGLSREERISAGGLGRLLLAAYRSPVMPEFIASLPLVAYDGTMKTGSLADVASLAGYVLDRNGRRLALVFFVNHANANAAQPAQDALLRWAYESAR